jgi:hypothetical protein
MHALVLFVALIEEIHLDFIIPLVQFCFSVQTLLLRPSPFQHKLAVLLDFGSGGIAEIGVRFGSSSHSSRRRSEGGFVFYRSIYKLIYRRDISMKAFLDTELTSTYHGLVEMLTFWAAVLFFPDVWRRGWDEERGAKVLYQLSSYISNHYV